MYQNKIFISENKIHKKFKFSKLVITFNYIKVYNK